MDAERSGTEDVPVILIVDGMLHVGALEAFAGEVVTAQERLMTPAKPFDGVA